MKFIDFDKISKNEKSIKMQRRVRNFHSSYVRNESIIIHKFKYINNLIQLKSK